MRATKWKTILSTLLVLAVITTITTAGERMKPAPAKSIKLNKIIKVRFTAYCACAKCCGSYPGKVIGQTASTAMVRAGLTLATNHMPHGTHIYLKNGSLIGVVEDRMSEKHYQKMLKKTGLRTIDIYMPNHAQASIFGVREESVYFVFPKK
jgi:3D (Asp-Asp-Asp) domain-containing protein